MAGGPVRCAAQTPSVPETVEQAHRQSFAVISTTVEPSQEQPFRYEIVLIMTDTKSVLFCRSFAHREPAFRPPNLTPSVCVQIR